MSIFSTSELLAKLVNFDIQNQIKHLYSFKDVCDHFAFKHSPLIDKVDGDKLRCMTNTVSITEFCLAKSKPLNVDSFIHGSISEKNNQVSCLNGDRVFLKYHCDSNNSLCKQPAIRACKTLAKKLVNSLELEIASTVDQDIICHFMNVKAYVGIKSDIYLTKEKLEITNSQDEKKGDEYDIKSSSNKTKMVEF